MIGFRNRVISGQGAKLKDSISFQGSLIVAASCYRICISQVAIAVSGQACGLDPTGGRPTLGAGDDLGFPKVLWARYFSAGTARRHLLRISGAKNSVVAVTGEAVRPTQSRLCPIATMVTSTIARALHGPR
jgi:hypothetical protein